MELCVTIGGKRWGVCLSEGFNLAIPLDFGGENQPNAFGLPRAKAKAFEVGGFVGDTRRGGSANCFDLYLNPHGNGTHTECVGHILKERVFIADRLGASFFPSSLLSVPLETVLTKEGGEQQILSFDSLEAVWPSVDLDFAEALVIRTLPNESTKKGRMYSGKNPPYITLEAMSFLVEKGVEHLLIDLPSVDPEQDQGLLQAHHLFWRKFGTEEVDTLSNKTITEMIYVPSEVLDGSYLLSIQIPHFLQDAAPSRPFLFPLFELSL